MTDTAPYILSSCLDEVDGFFLCSTFFGVLASKRRPEIAQRVWLAIVLDIYLALRKVVAMSVQVWAIRTPETDDFGCHVVSDIDGLMSRESQESRIDMNVDLNEYLDVDANVDVERKEWMFSSRMTNEKAVCWSYVFKMNVQCS